MYSQLSDGDTAPNFDLEDLNGVSHELYDYLNDGKGAIIEFSATWCGICWNYHNNGVFDEVWDLYGPNGSDKAVIFFIEGDPGTSQPCIQGNSGCTGGSVGNWTSGVEYPLLNPDTADATSINSDYDIIGYPTLYAVGPNYKVYEVGQATADEWGEWIESFSLVADYELISASGCDNVDIEIEASGGFGNLQYIWSNGETGSVLEDVTPGTYTVEVRDDNGYEVEVGPIVVAPGNGISVGLQSIEDVSCHGDQDGYIEVVGQNGSGNFSYQWDNGVMTNINADLVPGDYSVVISDTSTGCTSEETFTITEPDTFDAEVVVIASDCEGSNGSLEIDVDGGIGSLIYFVNGQPYNQPIIDDLDAGVYNIIVRDATNCTVFLSSTIQQPPTPVADTIVPDIITCSQQMISLSADSSSIGEHIIHTWNLDTLAIDTGLVVQTDTFGIFTLTVKDTLSTCFDELTFQVWADTIAPAMNVATPYNVLTCNLTSTTLTGMSNTENAIFSWTTEDQQIIGIEESIEVSSPGLYRGIATDTLNGCLTVDTAIVIQNLNAPMIVLDEILDINCQSTTGSVSIQDDQQSTYVWTTEDGSIAGDNEEASITVESQGQYTVESTSMITGCTATQTYLVSSSTDVPEVSISQPQLLTCLQGSTLLEANEEEDYLYEWLDTQGNVISQGSFYETNLPGDYTLRVTDPSNGCIKLTTVSVEQDIEEPAIVLESQGSLTCREDETTISVESQSNLSYAWMTNNGVIVSGGQSSELKVSAPGTYQLILTNTLTGCTAQTSYQITENFTSPNVAIMSPDILTCDLSQMTLVAEQNDQFTYEWTTLNGMTVGPSNQSTLQVNAGGTYELTTTDTQNGCTSIQSIKVEEDRVEPTIEVIEVGSVDCSGANALIIIDNNPNLQYEWSTQDGSIIGSNESPTIEVNQAGTYQVTATNQSNGCSSTQEIEVVFSQAPPLVEVSGNLLICTGESTTLCMTSSDGDTQWFLDGNLIGTDQCVNINQASTVEAVSTNSIGCSASSFVSVNEYEFPEYSTTGGQQLLDCITPSVTLSYQIEEPQDFSVEWTDASGLSLSTTENVEINLPGIYTLTLVNATTGCSESSTVEVGIDETTIPTTEWTSEGELTQDFEYTTDSTVDTQVWSFGDGATSTEANPTYSYVLPGLYEVCLTTQNKCGEHTECNDIVAAIPISISGQVTSDVVCYGEEGGSINLSLTDGLAPYTVEWTGPNGYIGEGQEISSLFAGDYQATITDAGNTDEVRQFTIDQPTEIQVTAEIIVDETIGEANGSISIIASGGTGSLTYAWAHGPTTQSVNGLEAGDYSVSIKDASDCEIIVEYTIGVVSSVSNIVGLDLFEATPNPTSGLLSVDIVIDERQDLRFSLLDLSGKVHRNIELSSREESFQLDLTNLPEGVYLMRLTNGSQVNSKRIVIVR